MRCEVSRITLMVFCAVEMRSTNAKNKTIGEISLVTACNSEGKTVNLRGNKSAKAMPGLQMPLTNR